MKLAYCTIVLAAGLAASSPSIAQVPGGGGVPVQVNGADTPSQDRVICRSTKVIGSRLKPAKVCMTAKQWEADRMEQRRTVEKGQNQRTTTGN